MKKSIMFLTIVSLFSLEVYSCSPATAVIGTTAVGIATAAGVYVIGEQEVDSYDMKSHKNHRNWAIGSGILITIGAGYILHSLTPAARLAHAKKMLAKVKTNPLLRYHGLIKTPEFVAAIHSQHVLDELPYITSFRSLKRSKEELIEAVELVGKARSTAQDNLLGKDVLGELRKKNQILTDLMLEVKSQPTFVSQYIAYKKIKNR